MVNTQKNKKGVDRHKKILCNHCRKCFRSNTIKKHKKACEKRLFVCSFQGCEKRFTQKKRLTFHVKKCNWKNKKV
jgi:hypothetical protein